MLEQSLQSDYIAAITYNLVMCIHKTALFLLSNNDIKNCIWHEPCYRIWYFQAIRRPTVCEFSILNMCKFCATFRMKNI